MQTKVKIFFLTLGMLFVAVLGAFNHLIFGAAIACLILVLLFLKLEGAFYLLIILLILSALKVELGFLSLSIPNVLMILIFLLLLFRGKVFPALLKADKVIKFCYLLVFLTFLLEVISTLRSQYTESIAESLVPSIRGILLFILPILLIDDIDKMKKSILFLAIGVTIASVATIIGAIKPGFLILGRQGEPSSFGPYLFPVPRTNAFFKTTGLYGQYVLSITPLILFSVIRENYFLRNRIILLLMFLVIVSGLLITQARGVWLSFMISTIVLLFIATRLKYLKLSTFIFIILCSPLFTYLIDIKKLFTYTYEMRITTIYGRILYNEYGLMVFMKHPILGVGNVTFDKVSPFKDQLHNMFIYKLMSGGLIGFIPYFLAIAIPMFLCYAIINKTENQDMQILSLALFTGLVAMLVEGLFFEGFGGGPMWLVIGLIVSCVALQKKDKNNSETTIS